MLGRDRLLHTYFPWCDHVRPNVIEVTNGTVFALFRVEGHPWETVDQGVRNRLFLNLNETLLQVPTDGVTLTVWQCRGLADPSVYPQGRFTKPYSEALDLEYRSQLFDRSMWDNAILLGVQIAPGTIGGRAGKGLVRLFRDLAGEETEARIERLNALCGLLREQLAEYRPARLGLTERNGLVFSEIAEEIAFAVTGLWRPVPLSTGPLVQVLSEEVKSGGEAIEIRHAGFSTFAACLGWQHYAYRTSSLLFAQLLAANYRCTVMQSWRPLNQMDGEALATRKQNRLKSAGDRALLQIDELNQAANEIASNRLRLGAHGLVLTVFHEDPAKLSEVVNAAWTDLAHGGAQVTRETRSVEAAWASMVPGNPHLIPRPGACSSKNFAALAPLYNFPSGRRRAHWGEPIAMLRTTGGTPYRLHLHEGDVGHWFVSGETGSGKSTLLSMILAQANRLAARAIVWDKDRGLHPIVAALGGTYMRLGVPTGLAPLKALTDDPDDIAFLAKLIRGLVSAGGHYEWTPEEDRCLILGLKTVMSFAPEDRWLADVRAFLGPSRTGAGARLERWCWGKELGGVIDCPEDVLDFGNDVVAFDQTDILDNVTARGPVMATLFHRTCKVIGDARYIFVVDEFWRALQEAAFCDLAKDALKTWRKKRAAVLLATQSVGEALQSPIGATIREQTPSIACFTNAKATLADCLAIGLNETEYEIVKALPKGQGWFFLKQGNRGVKVQMPLGGMPDDIAVMSGNDENLPALDAALARVGTSDPVRLVAEYHRVRKEEMVA
jgi:type IV secretion system protein VirB4